MAVLLADAGVPAGPAAAIGIYGAALLEKNRRVNLTGAKTVEALLPHLLDSLAIAPFIGRTHVDIGSGGGLPAIPAALVARNSVTLIEARAKKAAFLSEIARQLGLAAAVVAKRAEDAAREPSMRETFETATARALGHASTVAELTLPFLRMGGRAILQRGAMPAEERAALDEALLVLGGRIAEERAVGGGHAIVLVEKIAPTGFRFPRRPGIPAKRPLGAKPFHGKPTGETE